MAEYDGTIFSYYKNKETCLYVAKDNIKKEDQMEVLKLFYLQLHEDISNFNILLKKSIQIAKLFDRMRALNSNIYY